MRWRVLVGCLVLSFGLVLASPASTHQERYRVKGIRGIAWDDLHQTVLRMMADCTDTEAPEGVRWHAAVSIVRARDGQAMRAITDLRNGRVVLALPYVYDGRTISHEALHLLLGGDASMDVAEKCLLNPMSLAPREEM